MKIILSHPTGNANVRAVAKGLAKSNLLISFYTSLAIFQRNRLYKLGNIKLFSELHRRKFDSSLEEYTHSFPTRELGRIIATKLGYKKFVAHEKGMFSVDAVYRNLDKIVASKLQGLFKKGNLNGVYAYEDGAAFSFVEANRLGLTTFYDLPTGYWRASRKLLANELENYPEWSETFTGFKDSRQKLDRKDTELALADIVFVASRFTASTLKEYPGKLPPIKIIP